MICCGFVVVNRRRSEGETIILSKILAVVEFSLSLPGANAAVGSVFSLVNALWTDERNRLEVSAVKSIVLVKHHFRNSTCPEFHEFRLRNRKILEQIHSPTKYISATTLQTQMEEVPSTHAAASTSSDFLKANISLAIPIKCIAFPRDSDVLQCFLVFFRSL
jgi:hypothetical protein